MFRICFINSRNTKKCQDSFLSGCNREVVTAHLCLFFFKFMCYPMPWFETSINILTENVLDKVLISSAKISTAIKIYG